MTNREPWEWSVLQSWSKLRKLAHTESHPKTPSKVHSRLPDFASQMEHRTRPLDDRTDHAAVLEGRHEDYARPVRRKASIN
jgi:hypothetical protein